MSKAEQLKQKSFESVYSQLMKLVDATVEKGDTFVSVSYKFFKGSNELLKYIIEKLIADGFTLRFYETRMQIRWIT